VRQVNRLVRRIHRVASSIAELIRDVDGAVSDVDGAVSDVDGAVRELCGPVNLIRAAVRVISKPRRPIAGEISTVSGPIMDIAELFRSLRVSAHTNQRVARDDGGEHLVLTESVPGIRGPIRVLCVHRLSLAGAVRSSRVSRPRRIWIEPSISGAHSGIGLPVDGLRGSVTTIR